MSERERDERCADLLEGIAQRETRIAVVGLGYVGLTAAVMFADAGYKVVGVDVDERRVEKINAGEWPLDPDEPELPDRMLAAVRLDMLTASTDRAAAAGCEVAVIAVPTPVLRRDVTEPFGFDCNLAYLWDALCVLRVMAEPGLLIIESTVPPGTTDDVAACVEGDFLVAHCPERLEAGRLWERARTVPRIVGGADFQASLIAFALYKEAMEVDSIVLGCSALEAEVAKTAENADRDVQIAFANELAILCEGYGASFWRVREMINSSDYHSVLRAGAGVGGHCLPKDPWFLVGDAPGRSVIRAARDVNVGMPRHVAELTAEVLAEMMEKDPGYVIDWSEKGYKARVAILGTAYRADTADDRNSPGEEVARLVGDFAEVVLHDPLVPGRDRCGALDALNGVDVAVLVTAHRQYLGINWEKAGARMRRKGLVDGRGVVWPIPEGFVYRGVGRPPSK